MFSYEKVLLSRLPTAQANLSFTVNDVNNGSPSRIRRVLRISFGMTILPKSSTRRTMPVAFISFPLLVVNSSGSVCRFWGIMREPVFKVKRQGIPRLRHFNPCSPRGERPNTFFLVRLSDYFNPRSPRGERLLGNSRLHHTYHFNPRSPRGERRGIGQKIKLDTSISIHAPREGSDSLSGHCQSAAYHFNPRSPRGERRCQ